MKIKKQLYVEEARRLAGLTSRELVKNCPDGRSVFPTRPCTNAACPWTVRERNYMNCSFVASEAGGHTLEAIGEMMGITREGARLIERRGLIKLRINKQLRDAYSDTPVHQSSVVAGPDFESAVDEGSELADELDVLSAFNDRKLA